MLTEEFTCAREGLTIRGTVFRPDESRGPAYILSHHFLADRGAVRQYAVRLAENGFRAFTYDFCGGGFKTESDGKSEDMTVETEVLDLKAVTEYVKLLPWVDAEDVSLLGCSQGGFVSAMTASRNPGVYRKLILFYPAICIPDDARRGNMLITTFDPKNMPELICEQPFRLHRRYAETVMEMDPYEEIRGFDGPVLLMHGTADEIVNIRYSREAEKVYTHCEYHEFEGAGHGFGGQQDEEAMGYMIRFAKA